MNVASLDLCKELYELSGWDDTYFRHWENTDNRHEVNHEPAIFGYGENAENGAWSVYPAYDLGYLMRKLPVRTGTDIVNAGNKWVIDPVVNKQSLPSIIADTPEDAACKLAIELFKQGILTKE